MATTPPKVPLAATTVATSAISEVSAVPITTVAGSTTAGATTTGATAAPAATTFPVTVNVPTTTVTVANGPGTSVTFSLVVTDDLGQKSVPATATVTIQGLPTAKLTATPSAIAAGQPITLSGAGSAAAAPGTITTFTFSLVPGTS